MIGLFATLLALPALATPASVRYDQTQTGDYNIHLDLKNIEVLAIFDDTSFGSVQYDDYDYADLTLKPPKPDSKLNSTDVETGEAGSTQSPETTTKAGGEGTPEGSSPVPAVTAARPVRRCGAGFYRDALGRCRRLRRPPHNPLSGIMQKVQNKLKEKPE